MNGHPLQRIPDIFLVAVRSLWYLFAGDGQPRGGNRRRFQRSFRAQRLQAGYGETDVSFSNVFSFPPAWMRCDFSLARVMDRSNLEHCSACWQRVSLCPWLVFAPVLDSYGLFFLRACQARSSSKPAGHVVNSVLTPPAISSSNVCFLSMTPTLGTIEMNSSHRWMNFIWSSRRVGERFGCIAASCVWCSCYCTVHI